MNLYRISQVVNDTYDTYSDAVVCAPDVETARNMNPGTGEPMTEEDWNKTYSSWCASPYQVTVELLGPALPHVKPGVVCASFHAG